MYEKILVVEDDTDMRNMISGALMREFYQVVEAEDGEQAVTKYFHQRPNLILLDLLLPKLDGFEVMRTIREKEERERMVPPIVIFSNFDKPEYISQAKSFDVREYFLKADTEIQKVVARIKELLAPGPQSK